MGTEIVRCLSNPHISLKLCPVAKWPLLGWPATCLMRWIPLSSSSSGVVAGLNASSMLPEDLRWWTSIRFRLRPVLILVVLLLGDCPWDSTSITSNLLSSNSGEKRKKIKNGLRKIKLQGGAVITTKNDMKNCPQQDLEHLCGKTCFDYFVCKLLMLLELMINYK